MEMVIDKHIDPVCGLTVVLRLIVGTFRNRFNLLSRTHSLNAESSIWCNANGRNKT